MRESDARKIGRSGGNGKQPRKYNAIPSEETPSYGQEPK